MARRLGAGERFRIEAMVGLGLSVAEVTRRLGRSRSAVWREVARNERSVLGDYRCLTERPVEVDDRCEAGHWEGDLIIGRNNRTAIISLVERTSRHTLLVALPDGYDTNSTARAATAVLGRQPSAMVKTLTWDQGTEMAQWADIENALGIEVYFCEARSPWQRATNEQIRRWVLKSTDLDINPVRLAIIEDQPDTMPRKPPQLANSPNHLQ